MLHKNQRRVFGLIQELSGQKAMIVIPRFFIRLCGGYEEAAMLSQLLYWYDPDKRDGWIYKSRRDWSEELEITEKQARRAKANLEALGFIKCTIRRINNSPTTLYRPEVDAIMTAIENHWPKRADDWPSRAAPLAPGGQSIYTQDYTQNSVIINEQEREEARQVWESIFTSLQSKAFHH